MRKLILVFTAVVLTASGFAQKTADLGIWGGSSTYWGDIKGVPPMQTFNLNFGAFFRYNFNTRVAMRAQILSGSFSAVGNVEDIGFEFAKNAQDISLMMEINYLKYLLGGKKTPFTPYILGGVGIMYFPYELTITELTALQNINPEYPVKNDVDESVATMVIPLGFGFKFSIGEKFGVGIEYQIRKMFSDKLDNVDDPLAHEYTNSAGGTELIKYSDFWHNNDWPGYLGVNLTFKINLESKPCPAYDKKYW
ncbi:MAG: DUF6089 family protein [Mariniphaga sp.]